MIRVLFISSIVVLTGATAMCNATRCPPARAPSQVALGDAPNYRAILEHLSVFGVRWEYGSDKAELTALVEAGLDGICEAARYLEALRRSREARGLKVYRAMNVALYYLEICKRSPAMLGDIAVSRNWLNRIAAVRVALLLGDAGVPTLRSLARDAVADVRALAQDYLDSLKAKQQ